MALAAFLPLGAMAQPSADAVALVSATMADFEDRCGMAVRAPDAYIASLAEIPPEHRRWAANSPDGAGVYAIVMRSGTLEMVQMFGLPGGLQVACSMQGQNMDVLMAIASDPSAKDAYARDLVSALDAVVSARDDIVKVGGDFLVDIAPEAPGASMANLEFHFGLEMPVGGQPAFVLAKIDGGVFGFLTHVGAMPR